MSGDGASVVISHPWPTSLIAEPTCENTAAIQSARNVACRSGLHPDTDGVGGEGGGVSGGIGGVSGSPALGHADRREYRLPSGGACGSPASVARPCRPRGTGSWPPRRCRRGRGARRFLAAFLCRAAPAEEAGRLER